MKLAEHEITPVLKKESVANTSKKKKKKMNINKCESNNESAGKPN